MPIEQINTIRIGPKQAEKYLEKNNRNRKLSSGVVAKYASLMKRGEWKFDGSPIRFDTEGNVIDGQHRLWALIESDTTQRFLVIEGLGKETFATIDTGKSRSFGDILSIDHPGLGSVTHVAATTSVIFKWEHGFRGKSLQPTGKNVPASYRDMMEFFDKNSSVIIESSRHGRALANRVRGMSSSAWSLLVWLFYKIDVADAEFFFERMIDGIGLEDGNAILALRASIQRFVNQSGDSRKALPNDTAIAFGIKAWNYYRQGDQVKLITYRAGGANPEAFPTPR